jgi:hypothetical protein
VLISAPFNLAQGDTVYAKLIAVNEWGDSVDSITGSGSVIWSVPDQPTSLVNNNGVTGSTNIGLEWSDPVNTGGTDIIDSEIYYHDGDSVWVLLVDSISGTSFETNSALE